ncbi:hypothetical protein LS70_009045 [Helicobacter sp. MIT 11-5569]|uniref:hypothetical protein n=1 Tax=Helicobacter sp. MIT 11-5569 TaxID=1548151 RepID=UPI000689EC94|nr:hypothetical protein [Helicobacter sp. MIT 11-5569]TLD80611.1 hypothetical protein LS70_009045 [Helicobacter sp. MIT 11-5569]
MEINGVSQQNYQSGYESAKANAQAIGARLVSYYETEDMAMTTVTSDMGKSSKELQEEQLKKLQEKQEETKKENLRTEKESQKNLIDKKGNQSIHISLDV